MKSKKSQLQMMETIAVLFVFFILVAFGLVFYMHVMRSEIGKDIEKFQELSKIEIAQLASSLPELQCSEQNIIKSNCIDEYKLIQASSEGSSLIFSNAEGYADLFSYSRITVEKIYPESDSWLLYDRQPPEVLSKLSAYFPITLYNPEDRNYYFGIITVEVFA